MYLSQWGTFSGSRVTQVKKTSFCGVAILPPLQMTARKAYINKMNQKLTI
jgi:hypothetical protein